MEATGKNRKINRIISASEAIENYWLVRVVRDGLITMIPVLMIGAFALILRSFPSEAYQTFISTFANGFLYSVFHTVYMATFGVMSLYMAVSFSNSYFINRTQEKLPNIWGVITSVICFLIMNGIGTDSFSISSLGATSVFLAMVTTVAASSLFLHLLDLISKKNSGFSYTSASQLNSSRNAFIPCLITIVTAVLISALVQLAGWNTVYDLITGLFLQLFGIGSSLFSKGLGFVFFSSVLWCFGIHGSNCLEGVANELFIPLLDKNLELIAEGSAPTEILSKPFFDCFILMGGCGSSICLLLAIILFSKDRGMRDITKTAAFPMLFNINELMVFGLPTVFNPILFIPFVMVPVVQYLIAYSAFSLGLVPLITSSVEWTTPVIIGGFVATGSVYGSVLQIVNMIVGVLIYMPFVRMMGKIRIDRENENREEFIQWYKTNETRLQGIRISNMHGVYGEIAKKISLDLKKAIREKEYQLFYQPQFEYDGTCVGVEALLRWPNNQVLAIYPPILIQLSNELGLLEELEKGILKMAFEDRDQVYKQFGDGIKISVNVTGHSISQLSYWHYLEELYDENPFTSGKLCIEITEQAAVSFDTKIISQFQICRDMGILFAIDDFSVGQTSVQYLKEGIFDMIKLDGSLVIGMATNVRCREIVASLVGLADSLGIDTLAEYVETNEILELLKRVGCRYYQGFLFSRAVPLKGKANTLMRNRE